MEYLLDLCGEKEEEEKIKEEEDLCDTLEIDPGLLLRNGHLSWLFHFVYSIPINPTDQALHFCINCSRYLASNEQASSHSYQHHQPAQGLDRLYPLILVQCSRGNEMGEVEYYVSIQALKEIRVPIGDVMSHLLQYPHPWLIRMSGAGSDLARCVYLHPRRNSKEEMWQGEMQSGRCAYRHCEKVFNNRQSHLRIYGIVPQFCSINCKIKSWLSCHSNRNN
ncbi:unnamed protein product [Calypogeia fissa]